MKLSQRIMFAKAFATGLAILSFTAFADTFWTGAGETSDWNDSGNWYSSGGNYVFGGNQVSRLPDVDPIVVTFSTPVSVSGGIWIENETKPDIVWRLADGAAEGAGFTTSFTSSNWGKAINVGSGKHGGLTIEGGVYYFPSELWIGNGAVDSYFTLKGGVFTNNSYTCIGYGGYDRTGTMTVDGGTYRQNSNTFIVGQGNHSGCKGVFNLISGSVDTAANATCSENQGTSEMNISGGSFRVGGQLMLAEGRSGTATTTMDIAGGSIKVVGVSRAAVGSNSSATITMSDGTFDTDNEFVLASGTGSTAEMTLSGGTFTPKKFWVGSHYSYTSSGCNATFTMTGGTLRTDNDQDIVVGGNGNAVGTFNMQGGTVNCGNTFHIAWRGSGTLNMTGGDIYLRSGKDLSFNKDAGVSAIFNFNGGTFHTDKITLSTREGVSQTITVNGGCFAPVSDQSNWLSGIPMTVGANGIGFDTAGHTATFAGTLAVADGVEGNFPIMKKGLGTLTISSDLDLERTFKFTIDTDLGAVGVGTIALTGSNTLEAGDKITVEIDPVNVETNVAYTVMTGLGELAIGDIVLVGTDFYTYTGEVTDGTLSVTLQYVPTAPITARYSNGAWGVYNANNVLIPNGTATNLTTYVFSGNEPAGDFATYAAGHKVLLESGTIAIDSAVTAGHVAVADDATVTIDASGAASLVADSLVNNGTLVFDGEITLDASLSSGTISIAEGAVLHLAKSQTITCYVEGRGEMVVDSGVTLTVGATGSDETFKRGTEWFQLFEGMLTIAEGATLTNLTDLHGENAGQGPYYFLGTGTTLKMAGGTISRFGGATNNENIQDVVIAEGTTNVWNNYQSRAGWQGVNLNLTGTFSGAGTLQANCGGRAYRFYSDLSEFGGVVEMTGSAFEFRQPISGGTWIANPTAVLQGYIGGVRSEVAVTNATLVLKGSHEQVLDNNSNVISTGTYTIGADATLKVADDASVEGITFAAGATLELLDDGALSDKTQTYVALTSKTPISGPKPTLVQPESNRGRWKLSTREVTKNETTTYQLYAQFVPPGFVIIIQ